MKHHVGPATMIPLDWCGLRKSLWPPKALQIYDNIWIIYDIYIYMSWLWRSHPHISQPLIHICLNKNESHPSKSFFSYLNIFKLDPNCAPCCVQPPRHGEPRRFRAPGDSRAPPGQPGRGVLRTSSGFSAAMGHGMVINSYGDGSKPYPPGEHQNSW